MEGYTYSFVDRAGDIATDQGYDYAGRFSEGLAFVILRGQAGYIDKTWKMVFTLQAASGGEFSEGHAPVQVDQKWGYIDRQGNLAISPRFDFANSFSEGLALVWANAKYEYIDHTGRMAFTPRETQSANPQTRSSVPL